MTIIVPSIALDVSLLDRMAASVDFPVENKVVINGGNFGSLLKWQDDHPDWRVIHYGKNLGFAGSVNRAPVLFPNESGWLLLNDDGVFMPGCLERICKAYDEHSKDVDMIYVNENQAFDICVWTAKAVRDFGTFDENFHPAYFEDVEMRCRFNLSDDFKSHVIDKDFPVKHGKPRACGAKYHQFMDKLKPLNESYMQRKWGTLSDKPIYSFPFNNMGNSPKVWHLEVENRAKREAICKEFWDQPQPSLYD